MLRSWNASASDNNLWQSQYVIFFGHSDKYSKIKVLQSGLDRNEKNSHLRKDAVAIDSIDWRYAFKRAYEGNSVARNGIRIGYCELQYSGIQ